MASSNAHPPMPAKKPGPPPIPSRLDLGEAPVDSVSPNKGLGKDDLSTKGSPKIKWEKCTTIIIIIITKYYYHYKFFTFAIIVYFISVLKSPVTNWCFLLCCLCLSDDIVDSISHLVPCSCLGWSLGYFGLVYQHSSKKCSIRTLLHVYRLLHETLNRVLCWLLTPLLQRGIRICFLYKLIL